MQDRPTFGALSKQGCCHLCSVANTTQNFSQNKFTNKKQLFGLWRKNHTVSIYGKMLVIEFSYNFLYVWNCLKLYEKKLPIYENCMISIFGQPGYSGKLTYSGKISKLFITNAKKFELQLDTFLKQTQRRNFNSPH